MQTHTPRTPLLDVAATTLLDVAVPVYSLRQLQQIDFGMVGAYLDATTNENVTSGLLIFASKYPIEIDPDEPIYVPLVSVYETKSDTLNFTRLPESIDSLLTPVATPESGNTHIKVPGIDEVFRKDMFITKRFNHRPNMFRRSTKGVLAVQNKHFKSVYSRTDLLDLQRECALPKWATHVYTPLVADALNSSYYDRIYRLATYRVIGETFDTVKKTLVYFQHEPVPSFSKAQPEIAERMLERSMQIMTIVPDSNKLVWTLEDFFSSGLFE